MSELKFKNEAQQVNYDLYSKYSPVPMEMDDGQLFFTVTERENLLRLLIYNVGLNRTMEIIEENR